MPNLRISELDFDTIKTNLKAFLQDQDEFTDYDFEGSGLNVLLDVLAYNTHYNAYLANMLVNEMFLDSAVKRASAVSIAKHLGYTPRSAVGSKATVNITVNNPTGSPETLTLDRFTSFTTTIGGNAFTFLNTSEETITPVNGVYTFNNVQITEGTLVENLFVSAAPGPDEKFELTDANIDTQTLLITVQTSATDLTSSTYTLSTDITGLTSNSRVYFLEENTNGNYDLYFGDGVIGKKLTAGNIIRARYLSVSGSDANISNNISQSFTTSTIGGSGDVSISVISKSRSGAAKEGIESIKFNAPKVNAARNRAVTSSDYEALITANFTEAESISVWGGEDNVPPIYGKVFISLKPFEGFVITESTKDNIASTIINNKKVLAIQPEFVDPEFFFVNLVINVTYNSSATTKSSSQLQTIIRTVVDTYFSSDLQKFNRDFNKSKLLKLILDSDTSVSSVIILIKLQKRFNISLNELNTFTGEETIKFENAITPGTLSSSRFFVTSGNNTILARIVDIPNVMPPSNTGTGTLQIRNITTGATINSNAGNVSYGSGIVDITGFTPTALPNNVSDFRITASIQEGAQNLQVNRNQVLVLDRTTLNATAGRDAGVSVNVVAVVE